MISKLFIIKKIKKSFNWLVTHLIAHPMNLELFLVLTLYYCIEEKEVSFKIELIIATLVSRSMILIDGNNRKDG